MSLSRPTTTEVFGQYQRSAREQQDLEMRFYAHVRLRNGTYKRTSQRRLDIVNDAVARHLPTNRPVQLLDVAISSGISTHEWMEHLTKCGVAFRMVATDILLNVLLVKVIPGVKALVDETGYPVHFDVLSVGLSGSDPRFGHDLFLGILRLLHRVTFRHASLSAERLSLVSALLRRWDNLTVLEDDLCAPVAPEMRARFDLIRAANVLNPSYFPDDVLVRMVEGLRQRLVPGGLLVAGRTDEVSQENQFSVFALRDSGFELIDRIAGGSEIESLILQGSRGVKPSCAAATSARSQGASAEPAGRTFPLVSAIIPVYNGEEFIQATIESVLNQTYPNVECIIVDDGSQDATPEIVKRFADRVCYIRKENGGVASARNAGAAVAKGEFLAFLDADDIWLPQKTAMQAQLLIDDPSLAMVYGALEVVDSQLQTIGFMRAADNGSGLRNSLLMELPIMTCAGAMMRTSSFAAIGGFDERLSTAADTDCCCRLACRYPVAPLHALVSRYRQHGKQMHLNVDALERDHLIICAKFFGTGMLPPDLERLRRRTLANLYSTISVQCFHDGRLFRGVRSALRAAIYHPLRPCAAAIRLIENRFRKHPGRDSTRG